MTEKSLIEEKIAVFDENYPAVVSEIGAAAEKAGTDAGKITLLAATKTVPVEVVNHAVESGITVIGENRVQEYLSKYGELLPCTRHFIGHLQTNKVKDIVGKVDMIESVDSVRLANEISRECKKADKTMDVLLEVNIGREESKSGFYKEELPRALETVSGMENIRVRGLMAIPPAGEIEATKKFFCEMNQLFVEIREQSRYNRDVVYLSMGMSADFAAAVECGANIVRVGTALFGKRNTVV